MQNLGPPQSPRTFPNTHRIQQVFWCVFGKFQTQSTSQKKYRNLQSSLVFQAVSVLTYWSLLKHRVSDQFLDLPTNPEAPKLRTDFLNFFCAFSESFSCNNSPQEAQEIHKVACFLRQLDYLLIGSDSKTKLEPTFWTLHSIQKLNNYAQNRRRFSVRFLKVSDSNYCQEIPQELTKYPYL